MFNSIDSTVTQEVQVDTATIVIGAIDDRLMAHINDSTQETSMVGDTPKASVNVHSRMILLTQFGVKGWKNLQTRTGILEFDEKQHLQTIDIPKIGKRIALTDAALSIFRGKFGEIGGHVYANNSFTAEEAKN